MSSDEVWARCGDCGKELKQSDKQCPKCDQSKGDYMKSRGDAGKLQLVVGTHPKSYKLTETRLNKPVCFIRMDKGVEAASMVAQDIDHVRIRNKRLTYFAPNNVAILLSVSNKSLVTAKSIFEERFDPTRAELDFQNTNEDKRSFIDAKSTDVCDYIEAIQTSIIFAYTAVEAFSNLSIPPDYVYQLELKGRGTKELYDKNAIERWLDVKEKVLHVLPEIYKTTRPDKNKSWSQFVKLEKYRHDIIHQKTISSTAFYKVYFQRDIFDICASAEQIIRLFYNQHAINNRTNPLWPWLINSENYFPISYEFDSSSLEVVGNLYEGYKEKS